jgi:hypothetical protein
VYLNLPKFQAVVVGAAETDETIVLGHAAAKDGTRVSS